MPKEADRFMKRILIRQIQADIDRPGSENYFNKTELNDN
jgi:hypothetical protein